MRNLGITTVVIGLFLFSGCTPEIQLKPWTTETLQQTEFSFTDVDMDKGEVEGDITLKLAPSLKLTGVEKYVIYWSTSRDKTDKGAELAQVSTKSAGEVLYKVPQNTALPSADVNYFLLYLKDGKGTEVFSGKSASVLDKFKKEPVVEPPKPVIEPDPTSDVEEPPKPVIKDSPKPVIEDSPKPVIEEPPKPVIKDSPKPVVTEDPVKVPLIIVIKNVQFEFDKSNITSDYKNELKRTLSEQDNKDKVKLLVVGHADERGSNEYNLALGERRAYAVKSYLISLGFVASNIKVISYGEEKPLDMNHTESAWAKNRRAETNVVD